MPIDACTKTSTAFDLLIDADQEVLRKGSASPAKTQAPLTKRLTTPLSINKKKTHQLPAQFIWWRKRHYSSYALPITRTDQDPKRGVLYKDCGKWYCWFSAQRNVFFLRTTIAGVPPDHSERFSFVAQAPCQHRNRSFTEPTIPKTCLENAPRQVDLSPRFSLVGILVQAIGSRSGLVIVFD